MWWKTTEIYRVSLPYNEIMSLDEKKILSTVNITIFMKDKERSGNLVDSLSKLFESNEVFRIGFSIAKMGGSALENIKTPAELEKRILKKYPQKIGNLLLIEWSKLKVDDVLVTADRTLFMAENVDPVKVFRILNELILRENQLKNILGLVKSKDGKEIRYNGPVPASEYELLISVINPKPDIQTVHWNVKEAIDTYIAPFLNDLRILSNFTVKSQWKYQVSFPFNMKPIRDDTKLGRHFALTDENLPHIITSIERKLGTEISNKPSIHLVVYVPPCTFSPLVLYNKNQRIFNHSIESFISAKWGGIIIANQPESACLEYNNRTEESIHDVFVSSHQIMETILYQLRRIFDLDSAENFATSLLELEQLTPRKWEKDLYARKGCIHMIHSASNTLQSLISLLGDIKNIVINDDVGMRVIDSYENIVKAKEFLLANDLEKAAEHAILAHKSAEIAFFDPSLLSLLYFPDEQKYAIYIPLYLPIMIPSIFTILDIIKRRKTKKAKED